MPPFSRICYLDLISEYIFERDTFKSLCIFIIYHEGIFVEGVLLLKRGTMRENTWMGEMPFRFFLETSCLRVGPAVGTGWALSGAHTAPLGEFLCHRRAERQ